MILASWTLPEVAAVNGLVADRHLEMCLMCISHFVGAPVRNGVGAGGCVGRNWRAGLWQEAVSAPSARPLRKERVP